MEGFDSEFYEKKNAEIVKIISNDLNILEKDAMNLWYNSKTRFYIIKWQLFERISSFVCLDEIKMELSNDPDWLRGQLV